MRLQVVTSFIRALRGSVRSLAWLTLLVTPVLLFLYKLCTPTIEAYKAQRASAMQSPILGYTPHSASSPTVNLVVATVLGDDISWTNHVTIPNLNIIRYIWDDPKSPYHPVKKKGREAMMYHTYFHTFYDSLPDITILVHAHESPWHVESVLFSSLTYTLSHLDLDQVLQRQYVNLRVSWQGACPDWINTTVSLDDPPNDEKQEEPYMRQAFLDNFFPSNDASTVMVPEILAQPCCSQFAVTRDAVRSHPRQDYARHIGWLADTNLTDYISGRTWEHMWQYLFTGRSVDCPVDWKAVCRMYHVCFAGPVEMHDYIVLGWERDDLMPNFGFWKEFWDPETVASARKRIKEINIEMDERIREALKRGEDEDWRLVKIGDIYEE